MNASSINQQALLKSAGIGVGVSFVVTLLTSGLSLVGINIGGDLGATIAGISGLLGTCACCFGILAYIGVGALYGYFAGQSGTPVEPAPMAIGGAVTGVAVGFLSGICNAVFSLLGSGVSSMSAFEGLSGAEAAGVAGVGIVFVVLGLCVGIVISAALGAGGGALYALIQGNRAQSAPPAPPAM